jgi:hypothetical protein
MLVGRVVVPVSAWCIARCLFALVGSSSLFKCFCAFFACVCSSLAVCLVVCVSAIVICVVKNTYIYMWGSWALCKPCFVGSPWQLVGFVLAVNNHFRL